MMLLENREGQRGGTDSKTDGRIEKDRGRENDNNNSLTISGHLPTLKGQL